MGYRLLGVEGLRGLACESAVEALVVKLGFYARRRCSAAGDVFAQRARAMCEARARRRRIAAATPSARSCLFAVYAAARAKIAAVLRRAGAVSICGAFARVLYVSGRGREQYAGCKSGEPEC